ncbi:DUF2059 domain-containing protein [Ovoidimarina sediminis]|uniref:DUF2059 domain-containing protein n=1 Tax=Ovoidimarina sediminis TaxID=3079856 RepID=UPI0029103381|nr:DUF2059 domain-containing protein [Rhodophyticola sp. MJ-SS7]MDU8941753.1 DUF2059 domain-containing protein [Rhodophyticola sp. MJ-SS7]
MSKVLSAFVIAAAIVTAPPAMADRAEDLRSLGEAIGLPRIIALMREEGLAYGDDIANDMFGGVPSASWQGTVDEIYDTDAMLEAVEAGLEDGLAETDLDPLLEFFTSERGQRIIDFEISARAALMDEDIEAAAEETYLGLRDAGDARLDLLDRFVEANDLVESNVMGAMNSNYAFYEGLADSDALPPSMTENDMLREVWSQEDLIREDTTLWVFSYLSMAYRPLDDADLEAYIAISETEAGQALNRALFDGFDDMYVAISRALGQAAGRLMGGQDI